MSPEYARLKLSCFVAELYVAVPLPLAGVATYGPTCWYPSSTRLYVTMLDGSNAPMEGGFGRTAPSKSVAGMSVALPAPAAGDAGVMRRLAGAPWNCGSAWTAKQPSWSPDEGVLAKKRLSVEVTEASP